MNATCIAAVRTGFRLFTLFRLALVGMAIVTIFVAPTAHSSAALVHHWQFDEPNGASPPQIQNSVSSNHGTFVNMNDTNRSSDKPSALIAGRSLAFDGVNETVTLASQVPLADTANYSVAFWYRGTEAGETDDQGRTLIGRNSGDIYANIMVRGGKVEFMHYNAAWLHNISSTTSIDDDVWHHVAYVNHSTETGQLYVDGVLEDSGSSSISNDTYPFRIDGFMLGFPTRYADGTLDDIRVYNHALTSEEIVLLNQAPVPEPSTLVLLGLGSMGLAIKARRRRFAAA